MTMTERVYDHFYLINITNKHDANSLKVCLYILSALNGQKVSALNFDRKRDNKKG